MKILRLFAGYMGSILILAGFEGRLICGRIKRVDEDSNDMIAVYVEKLKTL